MTHDLRLAEEKSMTWFQRSGAIGMAICYSPAMTVLIPSQDTECRTMACRISRPSCLSLWSASPKIHSCVKCPKWGIKFPCLFQKSKMSDILMIFWWYDVYWIDVQYLKYSVYIKYTKMAIIIFSNQVINIMVIIVINNNSNNRNNLFLYISKLFFSRCLVSPHFLGQTQIWTSSQFLQLQQGSFTNFREPSSRKTLYSTPGEHQNRWNNRFWPKNMEIFGSNPTPK